MNRRTVIHLAWRARVAACSMVLWVMFGADVASAATLVPMCGEHAETVIAPPVSRPTSDAAMRAPCSHRGVLGVSEGAPEGPREPIAPQEAVPRVLPIYHRLAPVPRARAALDSFESGERTGFGSGIERPPRRVAR